MKDKCFSQKLSSRYIGILLQFSYKDLGKRLSTEVDAISEVTLSVKKGSVDLEDVPRKHMRLFISILIICGKNMDTNKKRNIQTNSKFMFCYMQFKAQIDLIFTVTFCFH